MASFKSPIRIIKTDFRAGELDPLMAMRHDIGAPVAGAISLSNMLVSQNGPVSRRPGMRNMAALPARARLVAFDFDADEKYVCAFRSGNVDIYNPDGTLAATIAGPWNATTIWQLTVVQKFDVMIIVHTGFQMRRLRRTGIASFVLETVNFSTDTGNSVYNQPYFKFYQPHYRMKVSSVAPGAATLTSEQAIFDADWVGVRIRIFNCEMLITGFTSASVVSVSIKQRVRAELGIAPFRMADGSSLIEVTHASHGFSSGATVTISGAADWDSNLQKTDFNGARVITVTDADHYEFTAADTSLSSGDGGGPSVHVSSTDYTRNWTEAVWSVKRGWPGCIALHENRLWLGGGRDAPTFVSASAVGDYYDHNVRDGLDDNSIQGNISTLSKVVHMVSSQRLQFFAEDAEAVAETQQGEPITPGNFKVTVQSHYGASSVAPQLFDGATLFVQRDGKNIRELTYDYNTDSQVAAPVSILSSHLLNAPFDMAVLDGTPSRPEQYAFLVNSGGSVAVFHSLRNEKLNAWTPMHAGGLGLFDSVCCMGHSVFFSVDYGGLYYLERFELDATDIWLDHAKVMGPVAATSTWVLGSAYAGLHVDVMTRNNYLGAFTANGSGTITLPFSVSEICAGFNYFVQVIPNPPDKELTDGPMTGEIRRILSTTVHWHNTSAVAVNGQEQLHFNPLSNPASPARLNSGKKRLRMLGWRGPFPSTPDRNTDLRDPTFHIEQPTPGPLTILGMSMEVSI